MSFFMSAIEALKYELAKKYLEQSLPGFTETMKVSDFVILVADYIRDHELQDEAKKLEEKHEG
jgi:hypothetical protein